MADTKISALTAIGTVAGGDKVPVADADDLTTTKSATMDQIKTYFDTLALSSANITALPAASDLAEANSFPVSQSGTAGEATFTQVLTFLQNNGLPRVLRLNSQYTNATTTGTEVTGLSFNSLPTGTYFVRWALLHEVTANTTSVKFGVNVSDTVTEFVANAYFPSAGVTAATGTMHNAANATTGQVWAYANTITESSTAPNLGPWVGTTNANVPHLLIIEALVVISASSADIELWCGSEVAAQVSLEVGSSGICYRTA